VYCPPQWPISWNSSSRFVMAVPSILLILSNTFSNSGEADRPGFSCAGRADCWVCPWSLEIPPRVILCPPVWTGGRISTVNLPLQLDHVCPIPKSIVWINTNSTSDSETFP
jgi:hypothetical protein